MKIISKFFVVTLFTFLLFFLDLAESQCAQRILPRTSSPELGIVSSYATKGQNYFRSGDYVNALKEWEEGLAYARKIDYERGITVFLNNIGNVYSKINEYRKSITYYEEALKIAKKIDSDPDEGAALTNLGNAYTALGEYAKAIPYFEAALKIHQSFTSGNKEHEGSTLNSIGLVYFKSGDYQRALSYYEKALNAQQSFLSDDKAGSLTTFSNIGDLYYKTQEYEKAKAYYEKALETAKKINNKILMSHAYENIGDCYYSCNEPMKALSSYEEAFKIKKSLKLGTSVIEAKTSCARGSKVGYVYIENILEKSNAGKQINKEIDEKIKNNEKNIAPQKVELERLRKEIEEQQKNDPSKVSIEKVTLYEEKSDKIKSVEKVAGIEVQELRKNLQNKLSRQLLGLADLFKKSEKYSHILFMKSAKDTILVKGMGMDLTDQFIVKLNELDKTILK